MPQIKSVTSSAVLQPRPAIHAAVFRMEHSTVRLDIQNRRPVEHIYAPDVQLNTFAAKQFNGCQADRVWTQRRPRGKHSMHSVIGRRLAEQFKSMRAIELPDHDEVREAFDVSQTGLKLRQDF